MSLTKTEICTDKRQDASSDMNYNSIAKIEHGTAVFSPLDSIFIANGNYQTSDMHIHTSSLAPSIKYEVSPTFQPLEPSLSAAVQDSLTIVYIVIFSFIFILVYLQLWMIWYYRHKRLSHQTLFLFMCLIWAGLRVILFSFYFKNCAQANELNIVLYWLLYSLPVCLQFSMLCLLLHFFSQVVLNARAKYEPRQYKYILHLFIGASSLLFTVMNIACAIVIRHYELTFVSVPLYMIYIRVTLTETMFLIYGILMSIAIFKITKMASIQRVLEAKGTTVRKAVIATIMITLLFLSRTAYNLISICHAVKAPDFGFDWINVTDQADVVKLSGSLAYVSFGVVLFVWEVLPVSIVVIFFRVKRHIAGQVLTDFSSQNNGARVFFFDNPRRYDSEDDLISQPSSDYLSTASSPSYNGDNCQSLTGGEHPPNNFLQAFRTASPTKVSSPSKVSNLPSTSSAHSSKGNSDYGAVDEGFTQGQ